MVERALPSGQFGILIGETEAAAQHLAIGVRLLRSKRYLTVDAGPVFSLLSIGMEKLLKVEIGFGELADGRPWPSKTRLRDGYGHRLDVLDAATLEVLARRLGDTQTRGTAPGWIQEQLDAVVADTAIGPIISCLADYAMAGRFYNLDTLAEAQPPRPSPSELWETLLGEVLRANTSMLLAMGTTTWHEDGVGPVNNLLADSVLAWFTLHVSAWQTGLLGWQAKMHVGPLQTQQVKQLMAAGREVL